MEQYHRVALTLEDVVNVDAVHQGHSVIPLVFHSFTSFDCCPTGLRWLITLLSLGDDTLLDVVVAYRGRPGLNVDFKGVCGAIQGVIQGN